MCQWRNHQGNQMSKNNRDNQTKSQLFKKTNRIANFLDNQEKRDLLKLAKVRKERGVLLHTLQKYKGLQGNIRNN